MEKLNNKYNLKGFTLLEVLLYSFFLAILTAVFLSTAFLTIASIKQIDRKILVESEGNFLLGKINWAFSSAQSFNILQNRLIIKRFGGLSNIVFTKAEPDLIMEVEGQVLPNSLNSSGAKLENILFENELINSTSCLRASFYVNAEKFFIFKCLK